jgi:hypothetical protein
VCPENPPALAVGRLKGEIREYPRLENALFYPQGAQGCGKRLRKLDESHGKEICQAKEAN